MLNTMHITDHLLPGDLLFFANFIWLLVLLQAGRTAPWRLLLAQSTRQHVFLGASFALFVIWTFAVGVRPGLGFHLMGVTVYTLMFGWALSVIGVSLVMAAVTVLSGDWSALALNALMIGVLPVSVSYLIYSLVHRYLPRHLFIYIFLCGFFNAMLASAVTMLGLMALLVVAEVYPFSRISSDYLPFVPLFLFPEGLLNGMMITALIGVRPDWLKTYDDEIYLKN